MRKEIVSFLFCFVSLTFFACSEVSTEISIATETPKSRSFNSAEFENNRAKWREWKIQDYSFDIDANGFLRPFLATVIEVRDSKLVSLKLQEPNQNKHWVNTYKDVELSTIDELFAFIDSKSQTTYNRFEVVYDDKYGFPVSIIYDEKEKIADDELVVKVTNFKVLE